MATCDSCGVRVSTQGYLGGGIICHTCAKAKRQNNTEIIEKRKEKYSNE